MYSTKAIENMLLALEAAGAGIQDVVSTVSWSPQRSRQTWLQHGRWCVLPSEITMSPPAPDGVTVLGYDHQLVEIEAVAAVMDPV